MNSEMSLVIQLFPTSRILLLQGQLFVDVVCFRSHEANDTLGSSKWEGGVGFY